MIQEAPQTCSLKPPFAPNAARIRVRTFLARHTMHSIVEPCECSHPLARAGSSSNCLALGRRRSRPGQGIIDLVGATVASILLAPMLLVIAVLIKLQDGGPILFWQTRVGRKGRCFSFPKFRSMITNAEAVLESIQMMNHHRNGSITFKMKRDPRITPIGRFIRKYSIDELPQLWCIFRGDMSLVGPRPPLPREVDQYNPHDLRRLEVAPGLTCLWQVEGRGDLPFEKQVELDIKYVDNQSLWLDFKLLFRTLPAVLAGKGDLLSCEIRIAE